jgi:uncharacterized membrane protein
MIIMSKTVDDGKACAILSYLIIGIVWFFVDEKQRKNTFAKFHVKQAIVFILALLVISIAVGLFSIISKTFSGIIGYILYAVMAIFWIISIVYAAEGKEKEMIFLGVFAKRLDF